MHRKQSLAPVLAAAVTLLGCPDDNMQATDGGDHCGGNPTLADFCDTRQCPTSIDEAEKRYCDWRDVRLDNECGGETLIAQFGNAVLLYSFDASGELVGVRSSDDVPFGKCDQDSYAYGNLCGDWPMFAPVNGSGSLCESE